MERVFGQRRPRAGIYIHPAPRPSAPKLMPVAGRRVRARFTTTRCKERPDSGPVAASVLLQMPAFSPTMAATPSRTPQRVPTPALQPLYIPTRSYEIASALWDQAE